MTFSHACAVLLALILLLHVYWAVGGGLLLPQALPSPPDSRKPRFEPGRLGAGLVALALSHALYTLGTLTNLWNAPWSVDATRYAAYAWTAILVLRVNGDFRFVGIFKRVRNTAFARADDWVFTPTCMAIGVGFALALRSWS
jgi:hypothetical protein